MFIHLRGRDIPEQFLSALSMLTDGGTLAWRDLQLDREAGVLRLSIRHRQKHAKRALFGSRVVASPESLHSEVLVKQILDCTIVNECETRGITEVQLPLGIRVRADEVAFDSAEEAQGRSLLSFRAKVAEIDVQIADGG